MVLSILKARHGETTKNFDYICMKKTGKLATIKELKFKSDYINGNNDHDNDDQKSFKIKNGDDHSQPSNPEYNSLRESFSKQDDSELKEIIA